MISLNLSKILNNGVLYYKEVQYMNKNLGNKILELRNQGFSYNEIKLKLKCSKGSISYHIGFGQKNKNLNRTRRRRKKHPYQYKLDTFLSKTKKSLPRLMKHKVKKLINLKIELFHRENNKYMTPTFTITDLINKFGENPKCYLTGEVIDINQPRTYAFDHKIPRSKGGANSLDNLGICTKTANQSKTDMSVDEYIEHCKKVLQNFGYNLNLNSSTT